MLKDDDDNNDDGSTGQTRYPVMPSLVALQQMRNRLALGYLGKKLMKWTAMATNKELRKLAQVVVDTYKAYRTDMIEAFMLLARARYFYPNMNSMVLENVNKAACLVRLDNRTITGVKVIDMTLVEKEFDPNAHLGIGAGGEAIAKAKAAWRKLLKTMVLMAELRTSFKCLDEANRNATKKQNVLGKLIIPKIMLAVDYIKSELEEQEREETFRLKRFKQSKEKKFRKETSDKCKIVEITVEKENVLKPEARKEIVPLEDIIQKEIVPLEDLVHKEIVPLEPNIIEKSDSDVIDETDIQKFKEMFRKLRIKLLDKDNENGNLVNLCSCLLSTPVYDSTTGKLVCPICELPTEKQHSCENIKMDIVPCTNFLPEDIENDNFFSNLMSRVEEIIDKTTQHIDDCQCDIEMRSKIKDECVCPEEGKNKENEDLVEAESASSECFCPKIENTEDLCACDVKEKENKLTDITTRSTRVSEPNVKHAKSDYPGFHSDATLRIAKAAEPYMKIIQTKKFLNDPFRACQVEISSKIDKASAPYLMQYRRHSFPKAASAYCTVGSCRNEESAKLCISSLTDLSNIPMIETYITVVAHQTTSNPNSLEENEDSCICESTTVSKPKSNQKDSSTYVTVVQKYKFKQPSQENKKRIDDKENNSCFCDATSHDAKPQIVNISTSSTLGTKYSVGCVMIPQGDGSLVPHSDQVARPDENINSPSSTHGYVFDCPKEDTANVPQNSDYLIFICSGGKCCKPPKVPSDSGKNNTLNTCPSFKINSNSKEKGLRNTCDPSNLSGAASNKAIHDVIINSNGCIITFEKSHIGQPSQENNPERFNVDNESVSINQAEEIMPDSNSLEPPFPQTYTTGVVNTQGNIPHFINLVADTSNHLKETDKISPAIQISFPEEATCCNFGKKGHIGISASLKIDAVFSTQNLGFCDINEEYSLMSSEPSNREGIAGICGVNEQSSVLSCSESCGCEKTRPRETESSIRSCHQPDKEVGPEPYTREGKPGPCSITVQSAQAISPGRPIPETWPSIPSSAPYPEPFTREGKPGPAASAPALSDPCVATQQVKGTISSGRPMPNTWPCNVTSANISSPNPYTREGKPGPCGLTDHSTQTKSSAVIQSSNRTASEPYTREGRPGPCSVGEPPSQSPGADTKPSGGQFSKRSTPEPYTREGRPGPCSVGELYSPIMCPEPDTTPYGEPIPERSVPEPYTREGIPGPCNLSSSSNNKNEPSVPNNQKTILPCTREERFISCDINEQTSTKILPEPNTRQSKLRQCGKIEHITPDSKDTGTFVTTAPKSNTVSIPYTSQGIPGPCGVESVKDEKETPFFDVHNSISPHFIICQSANSNQASFTPLMPKIQVKITKSTKTSQNIHPNSSSQNVDVYIRCKNPRDSNNTSYSKSTDNADLIETNIEENVQITTSMFKNPDGTVIKQKEIITTRIEKQIEKIFDKKNADKHNDSIKSHALDNRESNFNPCGNNKPCPAEEKLSNLTIESVCDTKTSNTDSEPICANRQTDTDSGPKCDCGQNSQNKISEQICANRLEDTDSGPKCDCGDKSADKSSELVCANRLEDTDSGPKCDCGEKAPAKTVSPVCANRLEDSDSGPKCTCGDKPPADSPGLLCANRLEDTDSGPKCDCGEKLINKPAGLVCENRLNDTDSGPRCDCADKTDGAKSRPKHSNPIPSDSLIAKLKQNISTSMTGLAGKMTKQNSESERKFDRKCNICNHSKCSCTSQSQCSNSPDYLPIVIKSFSKSKKAKEPEHYTIRIITKKTPKARDEDASDSSLINNVISALKKVVLKKSRVQETKITNKNICQTCYSTTTSESSKSACRSDFGSEKYYRCTNYGTESEISNKTLDICQRNIPKIDSGTCCAERSQSVLSKICNERSKEFWTAYKELNKALKAYKDAATSTKLLDRNENRQIKKGTIKHARSDHSRDSFSDHGPRKCLKRTKSN